MSFCDAYKGSYTSQPLPLTPAFWRMLQKLDLPREVVEVPETGNLFRGKRIGLGRMVKVLAGQYQNRVGKVIGKGENLFQVALDNGTVIDVASWDVVRAEE